MGGTTAMVGPRSAALWSSGVGLVLCVKTLRSEKPGSIPALTSLIGSFFGFNRRTGKKLVWLRPTASAKALSERGLRVSWSAKRISKTTAFTPLDSNHSKAVPSVSRGQGQRP